MSRAGLVLCITIVSLASTLSALAQRRIPLEIRTWEHEFRFLQDVQEHQICVNDRYKLIGGGVRVDSTGAGNLLTASFPEGAGDWDPPRGYGTYAGCWRAKAQSLQQSDPAGMKMWVTGIYDPNNIWEVKVFNQTGAPAQHPTASVRLPPGFVMTSGGAQMNGVSPDRGTFLTSSYPFGNTWRAKGKDHIVPNPGATATAYVVGIRPRANFPAPEKRLRYRTSRVGAHPFVTVDPADAGFTLVGGGADVGVNRAGNLLTASFPDGIGWTARSKDHFISSPADITAYGIWLR